MSGLAHLRLEVHPIGDCGYTTKCRNELDRTGAIVLRGFFEPDSIAKVVAAVAPHADAAYYANSTHNVYLTPNDPALDAQHVFNRQVTSSKGLIADDEIVDESPLRAVYGDATFRRFLCSVLGTTAIYPYADRLSSINVHFAAEGMELGWHFDNSSFAVTMLLQAPESGGTFEYVPAVRSAGDPAYDRVSAVLDGHVEPNTLAFQPGDLVLFRGHDALHRVTPTEGATTRMLAVFAFNDAPSVRLSDSALMTFYGRTA